MFGCRVGRFAKIPEDEAFLSEEERSSSESESDHSEEEREQKLLVLQNQVRTVLAVLVKPCLCC